MLPAIRWCLHPLSIEKFGPWFRESRKPFDLGKGPLARFTLIRCGKEDHIFIVMMHHIITDGWSTSIFYRELSTLYEAFLENRPSPLPSPAIQYADYAVWQKETGFEVE